MSSDLARPLAAAAASILWCVGPASGEPLAWDQAKVTELAEKLAEATRGVRQAFRQEPPPTIASGESRARFRLLDVLRRIETEARHLARAAEDGQGHDELLPVYENLIELVRQAQDERRRMFVQSTALRRIGEARAVLAELDPYFDNQRPLPEPVG